MTMRDFHGAASAIADTPPVPLDTEKIRKLREGLGLSQAQASKRAGLSGPQNWNRIERGRHTALTIDTLERIAAALGVHAKELLR